MDRWVAVVSAALTFSAFIVPFTTMQPGGLRQNWRRFTIFSILAFSSASIVFYGYSITEDRTRATRLTRIREDVLSKLTRQMTFEDIKDASNFADFEDLNVVIDQLIYDKIISDSVTTLTGSSGNKYRVRIYEQVKRSKQ